MNNFDTNAYFARGNIPQDPVGDLNSRLNQPRSFRGMGGHLMRYWLQTLIELGLPPARFEILLSDYIKKHTKDTDKSKHAGVVTPGNLRRELITSDALTWRSILRGWCVVKAQGADITAKLTWGTGKSSMHSIFVDLTKNLDEKTLSPVELARANGKKKAEKEALDKGFTPEEALRIAGLYKGDVEADAVKPRYTLAQIVTDPKDITQYCTGYGGQLMRLWYQILSDMKMSPERFRYLLAVYVRAQQASNVDSADAKPSASSALWREFVGEYAITWRRFIKGLMILKVKELELNVRLHWPDDKTTIHSITINLRQFHLQEEPDLTNEDLS